MKPIDIEVAIYRMHVVLFCGHSLREIVDTGVRHGISRSLFTTDWQKNVTENITSDCKAFMIEYGVGNRDILVWLRSKPRKVSEFATLVHELSHVVDRIASGCDTNSRFMDKDGDSEPRAFLQEYLFTESVKALKSKDRT